MAEPTAELQVTLVRLPRHLPRLSLACNPEGNGDIRLSLTAHEAPVCLEEVAWERLVTRDEAKDDTSYREVAAKGESVRQWFGEPRWQAGQTRQSVAIHLPAGALAHDVVFKAVGVDDDGHRVCAWGLVKAAAK